MELPEIECDDKDPCTQVTCDPWTGKCTFSALAVDNDKDGHKGPQPGFAAGDPGACGDDCDDTSPNAYPGATEICDGVDNDCNGVVDDNAQFVPSQEDAVQVDDEANAPAAPGGLAFAGDEVGYTGSYWGSDSGKTRVYSRRLTSTGGKLDEPLQITMENADASGGAMVWTGDRFGIVWSDRRRRRLRGSTSTG